MATTSKNQMYMIMKPKQNKLPLLIALELRFGVKGMTEKNQQELKLLTKEFYKCQSNT